MLMPPESTKLLGSCHITTLCTWILTSCLPVSYSWSPLGNASRTINTYWRTFNVKGNGTLVGEGFEVRWLAPPTRAFNSFYLEAEFRFLYIRFFHSFSTSYSCVARGFYNFNSNNKFVCEGGRQRRRRLKNSWYVIFLDRTTKKALKKKLRTFFCRYWIEQEQESIW